MKRERKLAKPLFNPIIIRLKEITTTLPPYLCGQDVGRLLFLQPTETGLGYGQVMGESEGKLEDGSLAVVKRKGSLTSKPETGFLDLKAGFDFGKMMENSLNPCFLIIKR